MKYFAILLLMLGLNVNASSNQPQVIKNARGMVIGTTEVNSGRVIIKNPSGRVVGYYVIADNKTFRSNSMYFGQGNQLLLLLHD